MEWLKKIVEWFKKSKAESNGNGYYPVEEAKEKARLHLKDSLDILDEEEYDEYDGRHPMNREAAEEVYDPVKVAIESVEKKLNALSDEEFQAEIDKYKDYPCNPDTCEGECQGAGYCEVATQFREKVMPNIHEKYCPSCWNKIKATDTFGCWMCGYYPRD